MNKESNTSVKFNEEVLSLRNRVEELEQALATALKDKEVLRDQEVKFRRLVESSTDIIFEVDHQGIIIYLSPIDKDLWGYDREDIIGKNFIELIHPHDRDILMQRFLELSAGVEKPLIYRIKNKAGEFKWVRTRTKPRIENGKFMGASGALVDITDLKQTEEALRESEDKYRGIFENAPLGIFHSTREGKLIDANPALAEIYGYDSVEELISEVNRSSVADTLYVDKEKRSSLVAEVTAGGKWKGYVNQYRKKDGTVIDATLTFRALPYADGSGAEMEGFIEDITRRRQAEEELKHKNEELHAAYEQLAASGGELEEKYGELEKSQRALRESEELGKSILKSVPHGLFGVENRTIFFANVAMEDVFGWKPEELVGKKTRVLFRNDEEWEEYGHMLYSWLRKMPVVTFESNIPFVRKDGTEILCRNSVSRIGSELSKSNRIVATFENITDRKQSEKALLESEERYRMIFNHSPLGVMHFDANGVIRDFNEKFSQIMGAPREKIIGFNMLDKLNDQGMLKAVKDALGGILGYYQGDYVSVTGGKTTPMRAIYQSIITEEGIFLGAVGIFEDMTEYKQAEAERRELEERLQRAEKMESLGLLAGGVAHDLNNVLGIVVGYAEMLIDEIDKSSPMREDLTKILEGGNRSAAIVQDLLTLARRGVQTKKAVNLNAVIKDCQNTADFEKVFSRHPHVKFKTDLEPDLLNIMGSPVHLGKTVINLVTNAIEAMPNGGVIKVATTNQYLDMPIQGYDNVREGDYVVLTVADTGEGILERDIKRIFEPFYTKKIMGRSGTGLGLAVVWGTVKDHNGYINVESEEGKGTIFTLYFPVTRQEIDSDQLSISMSEYMGKGEAILVVDDIKGQRDLASRMLTKLNYVVSTVASGEEAVEYVKAKKTDLIVLDMIMDPGIDGLETYEKILEVNPAQKAIIVSGFSESDRVREAQKLGAGAYVKKPYVLERLGMAVRKGLDKI